MPVIEAKYTKYSCGDAERTERRDSLGKKITQAVAPLWYAAVPRAVGHCGCGTVRCIALGCIAECWKMSISCIQQLHCPAQKIY